MQYRHSFFFYIFHFLFHLLSFFPSYFLALSPAGLSSEGHCLPRRGDDCTGLWLWTVMGKQLRVRVTVLAWCYRIVSNKHEWVHYGTIVFICPELDSSLGQRRMAVFEDYQSTTLTTQPTHLVHLLSLLISLLFFPPRLNEEERQKRKWQREISYDCFTLYWISSIKYPGSV